MVVKPKAGHLAESEVDPESAPRTLVNRVHHSSDNTKAFGSIFLEGFWNAYNSG